MFNTTILDVAIGMIFVYLLLSLLCTAANEIIELMLKKRAVDLERGIRELLIPGSGSGSADIVQELYNHPLVNGLFGGRYEDSRIANVVQRKIMRTALPSYIPSRTFALALMDLVLPGTSGAPGPAAAPPPSTASGAAGATPPPPDAEVVLGAPPPPPPDPTDPTSPLAPLRNAVGTNPLLTPHARQALTTLIDAAGHDVAKARENIEGWFDNSMDRVSSWYKRRTQVALIILGMFVAVTVNADSITIAKRLSTDRSLRESLVSAAQDYAKASAAASPTPPPGSTSTDACKENENSRQCKYDQRCGQNKESPECRYEASLLAIQDLSLPIGWDTKEDIYRTWPGRRWDGVGGWKAQIYVHFFGWVLTALAICLGAPFWFDLLNKFIVIRSAVKPHEKSPEEGSKD